MWTQASSSNCARTLRGPARLFRLGLLAGTLAGALAASACSDPTKVSIEQGKLHVVTLAQTVSDDVSEVRKGLPEGAKHFVALYRAKRAQPASAPAGAALADAGVAATGEAAAGSAAPGAMAAAPAGVGSAARTEAPESAADAGAGLPSGAASAAGPSDGGVAAAPSGPRDAGAGEAAGAVTEGGARAGAGVREEAPDPATVRVALTKARDKVAELRVAKSTFFGLADTNGVMIRNDQEQDRMAGKGLFQHFPELRKALTSKYVETRGSMPEAAAIGNRKDGQWIAASPVLVDGAPRALYLTGWSWSAYAYRLQFKLRSDIESTRDKGKNPPLVYVLMLVDSDAYSWDAPDVDLKAVVDTRPLEKLQGDGVYAQVLEVTGTRFGLAVKAVPVLGPNVAVAVLRAET